MAEARDRKQIPMLDGSLKCLKYDRNDSIEAFAAKWADSPLAT